MCIPKSSMMFLLWVALAAGGSADEQPVPTRITSSIGLPLQLVPAGEFLMGGDQPPEEVEQISRSSGVDARAEYFTAEQPQHRVRIGSPFYMGVHEVTQSEWAAVMERNPSWFTATGGGADAMTDLMTSDFPVEQVSWYDCLEFCNRLSARDQLPEYYRLAEIERPEGHITFAQVSVAGGRGYRLPTEAEWEYACRAGTTTPFHFGAANTGQQANVDGRSPYGIASPGPYLRRTRSVGKYPANSLGLVDMHGNVGEWCFDTFDPAAYTARTEVTADPVTSTPMETRVMRGGSCWLLAAVSRSAYRVGFDPKVGYLYIGLRVVRLP